MPRNISAALSVAREIRDQIFPSAGALLLSGSIVREEATASSDLDLVVIFERVENAKRQSFTFANWPVEVFIHDAQTLEYFFQEVDRPSGVPSLPNMVHDGIEIPEETEFGLLAKGLASRVLEAGPPPWGPQERDNSRYTISDLIEDIRTPRNSFEIRPIVCDLYTAIANHYCRSRNQWSAKGKSIPRRLMELDPNFHRRFTEAFEVAFAENDPNAVIRLTEFVLEPDGGFLFDGYSRDAPKDWRMPCS